VFGGLFVGIQSKTSSTSGAKKEWTNPLVHFLHTP
jgi:hypothetical protein